ncbi:MAG: hypothetical protein JWP87_5198 [Labilithrix sp.]|nr:hypothetical protein [Labilithrix sp.]
MIGGGFAAVVVLAGVACSSFSTEDDGAALGDASDEPVVAPEGAAPDASAPAPDGATVDGSSEAGHDAAYAVGCGQTPCTGDQRCCFDHLLDPSVAFHCANPNDACDTTKMDAEYTCDDTDDCVAAGKVGNVCCGTLLAFNGQYYLGSAKCVLAASCGTAHDEIRMCNRSLDGQCPGTKLCVNVAKYALPDDAGTWDVVPNVAACQR